MGKHPFAGDLAMELVYDTLCDREVADPDLIEERLRQWLADGGDSWEPFAKIIDGFEDELFPEDPG